MSSLAERAPGEDSRGRRSERYLARRGGEPRKRSSGSRGVAAPCGYRTASYSRRGEVVPDNDPQRGGCSTRMRCVGSRASVRKDSAIVTDSLSHSRSGTAAYPTSSSGPSADANRSSPHGICRCWRGRGYLGKDGDRRWAVWRVAGRSADRQIGRSEDRKIGRSEDRKIGRSVGHDAVVRSRTPLRPNEHRHRNGRAWSRDFLSSGSRSTSEIAEHFGVSSQAVSNWLRPMEEAGTVRPAEKSRRSKTSRWKLV